MTNQSGQHQINNSNELEKDIHTDFGKDMTYGDYLQLDRLLASQTRLSDHHDEMLFIVIHQVSELWMKQILHELSAAMVSIQEDQLEPAFKMLSRVSRIQQQLIKSWDVLSTLTPAEYMQFRHKLGYSSGFQSYQNRMIEFMLGHKNEHVLSVYQHQPELYNRLKQLVDAPSIYDAAIAAMANRGLPVEAACLQRNWSEIYQPNESVEQAWLTVYRDVNKYWDLYELAEKLVDIASQQQQWRFNHMNTVERIIGQKPGTGGSSGVGYLRRALDHRFFPELWSLRTQL
ncbi:tryptophan 2,3-dioxygenase [Brevibacillus choshinensis]|uniref:tryptophan 2,3-dioxygenase n=1 Tax=Brevibacillus choshinensis TaxID=54911 RepID=UPI002E1F1451|nr:tryptophan 2,3-dioxygenase [Brevibacillus choshinensis]MED4753738.1 tryptophan 2,3-dioxygenase [Brevibacillus choshinensis]MED4781830.1 tryptophan 2,3-dioxygenase [Brevibacillus choshinensis]